MKSIIGQKVNVVVTNPKGSVFDLNPNIKFETNFGIVDGVVDVSGEPQEAYVLGLKRPVKRYTGFVVGVIHRINDMTNKWVVSKSKISKEEILEQVNYIEQYFNIEIII